VGEDSTASDFATTAVGQGSTASASFATAVGHESTANAISSVAIGSSAEGTGNGAVALGGVAQATGEGSTAIGQVADATGVGSTALGAAAGASADNATALGRFASAGFTNSTAIGVSAATTRDDQMALGTSTNTYTAAGITSAASTAAQSGPVQVVTTDAAGNLAAADPGSIGLASADQVQHNTEGVAMAMALSGVDNILPNGTNYAVSANWGGFEEESAVAFGGAMRVYENIFASGGGAVGTNSGRGGGRAGVTFAW
jgi:hypothetical protein